MTYLPAIFGALAFAVGIFTGYRWAEAAHRLPGIDDAPEDVWPL